MSINSEYALSFQNKPALGRVYVLPRDAPLKASGACRCTLNKARLRDDVKAGISAEPQRFLRPTKVKPLAATRKHRRLPVKTPFLSAPGALAVNDPHFRAGLMDVLPRAVPIPQHEVVMTVVFRGRSFSNASPCIPRNHSSIL